MSKVIETKQLAVTASEDGVSTVSKNQHNKIFLLAMDDGDMHKILAEKPSVPTRFVEQKIW